MSSPGLILALSAALGGAVLTVAGFIRGRRPALDVESFFHGLAGEDERPADEFHEKLLAPFLARAVAPLLHRAIDSVTRFMPRNYLQSTHKKLLLAGLSGKIRAEEFVLAQAAATGLLTVTALAYTVLGHPSPRTGMLCLVLGPMIGALFPASWLSKQGTKRSRSILKDLPDTLDLLAISVEAGMGFEGALEIVCQHFDSPLADEFARTLQEMELGLPRQDAFQNLKHRTQVPELSNFVLALLQADALGIPIGRVLKTQSTEMRAKRRMWAREKAAKLPVKMLFPLIVFIFPTIMVVIIAPAASGISRALS